VSHSIPNRLHSEAPLVIKYISSANYHSSRTKYYEILGKYDRSKMFSSEMEALYES